MRNSGLLKWASNNKNGKTKDEKDGKKNWLHSPETLKNGHVAYLVKFLGSTEVDKPKGIEVVKQCIQKLKFSQQLKKSEGAAKTPKVELTISVEGVAIQEPKTKKILHQYPLHKISYCADDKAEKRFFSFISKESDSDKHTCFVFVSDKLAEEITLTIGQAFELAYKKFLDANTKDMEAKKTMLTLQKRIALLENENETLKSRLKDLARFKDVQDYMKSNGLTDLCVVESKNLGELDKSGSESGTNREEPKGSSNELICLDTNAGESDGFITQDDLNDDYFNPRESDEEDLDDFNPRADPGAPKAAPVLSPPPALPPRDPAKISQPPINNNNNFHADNMFGASGNPFATPPLGTGSAADPFGMSSFSSNAPFGNSFDSTPFTKIQDNSWTSRPAMPAINAMSLDDLDPLKK